MLIKPLHSDSFGSIRNLRRRTLAFSMLLLVFATSFAFAQRQKIRSEFEKDDWWAQKAADFFPRYQFTLQATNSRSASDCSKGTRKRSGSLEKHRWKHRL